MYQVRENLKEENSHVSSFSDVMQKLLQARGISNKEKVDSFMSKDYESISEVFQYLPNITKVCDRVLKAISEEEIIGIYSDYDCDGIPGGALLYSFFKEIGHDEVFWYTPDRNRDGYGVSDTGLKYLEKKGATLILTVDCGISDVEPIAGAKERGTDVVVIDHHIPPEVLPPVECLNPLVYSAPPEYVPCGAGCAYLLVYALCKTGEISLAPGREKWFLDLVGIATFADLVPLIGVNRIFAHYGLKVLRKSKRPGIKALCSAINLKQNFIKERDISFRIAPYINAASRMGSASSAFVVLTTDNKEDASKAVEELLHYNRERQRESRVITRAARAKVKGKDQESPVWVLGDPSWRVSLVGLAAQKIAEEYNKAVFVWGRDEMGVLRGSCRGTKGMDVYSIMKNNKERFLHCGGHTSAGGFAVDMDEIHSLEEVLSKGDIKTKPVPAYMVDAELTFSQLSDSLLSELDLLSPHGMDNDRPVFAFPKVGIVSQAKFGSRNSHMRFVFQDGTAQCGGTALFTKQKEEKEVTVFAHIERGRHGVIELRVVGFDI